MIMEFVLFANNETSIIAARINNKNNFNKLDNALNELLNYLNPKHGLDLLPTEEVFVRGNIRYRTISSRILFQNPEQFINRYLTLLKTSFELKKIPNNSQFIFSIEGIIEGKEGIVLESNFLNSISLFFSYNGYRLKQELQKFVKTKKILFIEPSKAIIRGVITESRKIKKPSVFIVVGRDSEFVYVNKYGVMRELNIQNLQTPDLDGFSANYWLTNLGLDDLLYSKVEDLSAGYTKRIADVLIFLKKYFENTRIDLKSIFFYTQFEYLIDKKILEELLPATKVYFPADLFILPVKVKQEWTHFSTLLLKLVQSFNLTPIDEGKYLIPVKGSLLSGKNRAPQEQIKKIELFSKNTLLQRFSTQAEFKNHWRMWRDTVNVENQYRFIYKDGMSVSYKIGELKYESQIDSIINN